MLLTDAERRAPGRGAFSVALYTASGIALAAGFKGLWRMKVDGGQHVPHTGAFILAPNHQSMLDPIICGIATMDRPLTYIARDTLFSFRPFGALIRTYGAVPIERGTGDSGAIRAALAELAAGRALLVYPEGTRCLDGRTAEFRPGVVLLARRAKVPILPLALEGSYDLWQRGRRFPGVRGWLQVEVGAPIQPNQLQERLQDGTAKFLEDLRHEVEEMRLRCRARLRERTNGAWPPPGPGDTPYWSA